MIDIDAIRENLLVQDVTIGGTTFRIEKFRAMEGFAVLESLRADLAKAAASVQAEDEDVAVGLLKVLFSLPPEAVERTRRQLFTVVSFTNERARTAQSLAGAEDMAFEGLEPSAVYEILGRALAVNFTESVSELVSLFSLDQPTTE